MSEQPNQRLDIPELDIHGEYPNNWQIVSQRDWYKVKALDMAGLEGWVIGYVITALEKDEKIVVFEDEACELMGVYAIPESRLKRKVSEDLS
jgi:hypothetical protein